MNNNEPQSTIDEPLADLGSVTKDTKGMWPYGCLWDGGAGYYYYC